ncbi:hypothetical protein [Pseudomonas sp. EggHat1]|uniref:hypothetical protein n=1 Tax=Pseudomonas sp. EggHat1 TaxID=2761624 RepID=UPI001866EF18|nr:hypothetical protein [Pseudomonas sp. EggHat1]
MGNTWKKIRPASTDFDGIGGVLQTVSSEPTGVLLLPSAGIYELSAQLYPSAPANSSAKISLYLGLIDHGPTGALDSLLKVANQEFPGGQHPSVSLTRMVEISAARQYSFNWYFLDGAAVTSTMVLPTESVYSQVSVKRLA